jgi:hypothetical protein
MVDNWLLHPKKILNFYTSYSKEFFLNTFRLYEAQKKPCPSLPALGDALVEKVPLRLQLPREVMPAA